MDLETALEQFDAVEANVVRLKKVFYEMSKIIPRNRSAVIDDEVEGQRYRQLQRSWQGITRALPPIGSYQIESSPLGLDALARARLEAEEVAQYRFESVVSFGTGLDEPWQEIQEYEARLRQARRDLVRDHLIRLMSEIDPLVKVLAVRVQPDRQPITDEDWGKLVESLRQVERLTGGMVPRKARWRDMRRHMSIGQGVDLHDIARHDWPSVRAELQENLYSELEPLPVDVSNIAFLVQAKPSGPVTTKLNWEAITAEEFERLLFNLVADAGGYANPQMLMRTNAPDRGRDISVERVIGDTLSGTRNQRVIIQAKHWLSKSVRAAEVTQALAQIALWEPPTPLPGSRSTMTLVNSQRLRCGLTAIWSCFSRNGLTLPPDTSCANPGRHQINEHRPGADDIRRHEVACAPADGARLAGVAADLVAVLLAHRLDAPGSLAADARQRTLMIRIQAFVDQHLADRQLSPGQIAAAHHIGVRTLHRLFAEHGLTVAGWIRERRLDRCRRDLADPRFAAQYIDTIARRWAFADGAHFPRAFKSAYGISPAQWRASTSARH